MASACFTLVIGALVLLTLYLIKKYTYWKRRGIPTVRGIVPFVGNILPVLTMKYNFFDYNTKLYNDYKNYSMIGYYKLLKPVLLIRDPELVKTVMQSKFSNFHDTGISLRPELDPLLSKDPFFASGDEWSRGRKKLTYAFSNTKLKVFYAAVSGVCKKFEDFLIRQLTDNEKYEIELKQLFSKFTAEIVANAGFGLEGFSFQEKKKPEAFEAISQTMSDFSFFRGFINNIVFIPEIRNLLRLRLLPREFDQLFRNIVKESLEIRRNDPTPKNDYLQLMMDLSKSTNEPISDEDTAAGALSFYVNGFETSGNTLSFVSYYLATHPDIQEKLRQEITSKIADYEGVLTFEALKEMTYMDQVISESLRCYPVISSFSRVCTEAYELQGPDGLKCRVEPGTQVIIPVHALQVDPQYWSDPEVFDPERFNEDRKKSIVKMTFLPFGEGPRMCVGMKMGMLQVKSCLATLLNKYKLELSNKTQLPLKLSPYAFVTVPIGGLWVHISKI